MYKNLNEGFMKKKIIKSLKTTFVGILLSLPLVSQAQNNVPVETRVYHYEVNGKECDMSLAQEAEGFDLGHNATLVLFPCGRGAYQTSYVGYIMTQFSISQVVVLSWEGYLTSTNWLSEAYYDSATKELLTFAKSRGIGDCGQTSKSKISVDDYGYVSIKTTEITYQDCLNDIESDEVLLIDNWPVVFKQ
jgi:hypothetical protein